MSYGHQNLMCVNIGWAAGIVHLPMLCSISKMSVKVCLCLLMWAHSLLHSQNLTLFKGPIFLFLE